MEYIGTLRGVTENTLSSVNPDEAGVMSESPELT